MKEHHPPSAAQQQQDDHPLMGGIPASANVIRLYGFSETDCGYCKGNRASVVSKSPESSSRSYTILVERMHPAVYEAFLLRGWRRSGLVLYKPDNWQSCCPAMTIRLPVEEFRITKSQRKLLKRMDSLLSPAAARNDKKKSKSNKANRNNNNDLWTNRLHTCLVQSGAMEQLHQTTAQALEQVLAEQMEAVTDDLLVKPNFKMLPPKPSKTTKGPPPQQRSSDSNAMSIDDSDNNEAAAEETGASSQRVATLMSSVCASIAGRSKGRIDRAQLSNQLLARIQPKLLGLSFPVVTETVSSNSEAVKQETAEGGLGAGEPAEAKRHRAESTGKTDADTDAPLMVTISKVESHEASGQIFVHLKLSVHLVQSLEESAAAAAAASSAKAAAGGGATPALLDRLAAWCQATAAATNRTSTEQPPIVPPSPTSTATAAPYELTLTTMPAHESALVPAVHRLYWKYQHAVHGDPDPFAVPPDVSTTATTTAAAPNDPEEKGDSEAAATDADTADRPWGQKAPPGWVDRAKAMLAAEYQDLDAACQERLRKGYTQFYEFLVENPFVVASPQEQEPQRASNDSNATASTTTASTGPHHHHDPATAAASGGDHIGRLGCYHQHYRIANGPLIGVGVVDLLPTGLSSVYLYYDPSFAADLVPLGKYAILKEIEWTRQDAALPYYYLGYYIESCIKMRYKADYMPSELLCPTTYTWVDAEQAKATIQAKSPQHHCCTLAETTTTAAATTANTTTTTTTTTSTTTSTTQEEEPEESSSLSASDRIISQVHMQVGQPTTVTLDMLTEEGQDVLRPILSDFVAAAGPDIAPRCTINLT